MLTGAQGEIGAGRALRRGHEARCRLTGSITLLDTLLARPPIDVGPEDALEPLVRVRLGARVERRGDVQRRFGCEHVEGLGCRHVLGHRASLKVEGEVELRVAECVGSWKVGCANPEAGPLGRSAVAEVPAAPGEQAMHPCSHRPVFAFLRSNFIRGEVRLYLQRYACSHGYYSPRAFFSRNCESHSCTKSTSNSCTSRIPAGSRPWFSRPFCCQLFFETKLTSSQWWMPPSIRCTGLSTDDLRLGAMSA